MTDKWSLNARPMYYRIDGTPYLGENALLEWAKDWAYNKHIAIDNLPNGIGISTVWLGIDHGFGSGDPVIFETMVFMPDKKEFYFGNRLHQFNRTEHDMERYSTLEQAQQGHKRFVERYSKLKSAEQLLK